MKNKLFLLIAIIVIVVVGVNNYRLNTTVNNSVEEVSVNETDSAYPWLNISNDSFSESDLQWSGSKQGAYRNTAVYQSYPSLDIKINNYENKSDRLIYKSMDDIKNEFKDKQIEINNNQNIPEGDRINLFDFWRNGIRIKNSYTEYGKLSTNYYPERYIQNLDMYDVDGDGLKESIVLLNYSDSADSGSTSTDIIEDGEIIFSVNESQSSIVQAETNNGFYIEWRIPDDQSPHCCDAGFMRTRFVYEDSMFKPLYEQEVRYVKVGAEEL